MDLDDKLYHMTNVLMDLCDKLELKTRSTFILKYNLSQEESRTIDTIFLELLSNETQVTIDTFTDIVNNRLERHFSKPVIEELLEVYADYQPKAIKRVKL